MEFTSPEFSTGGALPRTYTGDGEDVPPPLRISGVPGEAKALALIMGNPEARCGFRAHWLAWNIPPDASDIRQQMGPRVTLGQNDFGTVGYTGPRPEKGPTTYPYVFYLYALDRKVQISEGSSIHELWEAIRNHVLAGAELRAHYCAPPPW